MAAGCLLLSIRLMVGALKMSGFGAAPALIFSMASFILTVLLISPETVFRIAEWCSRPVTNLIFPNEKLSKPPLSYVLAREYGRQARLEDAIEQYQQIIHYYPDERDAYVELLPLIQKLGDSKMHEKYVLLFKKRFNQDVPAARSPVG